MRRATLGLLLAAALLPAGCKKSQTAPATTSGGTVVVPGPGGGVQATRTIFERERGANDLKQLVLFYQTHEADLGRPPASAEEFITYIQRDAPKLVTDLQNGTLVLYWNARLGNLPNGASNTVLGHDKDTPAKGGWVVLADGSIKKMSAPEFAATAKAGN